MSVARTCRVILVGAALGVGLSAPAGAADVTVVAKRLDNPRGLDVGPGGALYVVEAGRGGAGPCIPGPEAGEVCFGTSGAITRVDLRARRQTRIVRGLPSLAAKGGAAAEGPSDISFGNLPGHGRASRTGRGQGYLTVGLAADPAVRAKLPRAGAGMAYLDRILLGPPRVRVRPWVDLGAFEASHNPDAGQPGAMVDTNPNALQASRRGSVLVADAGGNDVLSVSRSGSVSVLGVLPFLSGPAPDIPNAPVAPGTVIPIQPVPTTVVRGRDGAAYVGQLTGFPFIPGLASVYRLRPNAAPAQWATGLTEIMDVAFGRDRSLYVVEFSKGSLLGPPMPGALIRVRPDGRRQELAAGQLKAPAGIVLDGRYAYVTDRGDEAGTGRVVRIRLPRR